MAVAAVALHVMFVSAVALMTMPGDLVAAAVAMGAINMNHGVL